MLYERHYAELVRLAFALTSDWGLAEELAQEAFVCALAQLGKHPRSAGGPGLPAHHRGQPVRAGACAAGCTSAGPGATPMIHDQLTPGESIDLTENPCQ